MRLLIVEDELEHRDYLANVARSWRYEVTLAADGVEALEAMRAQPADIILSDVMMPKMDGFELLETLRREQALPPVILMTAFGSLEKALRTIHELDGYWFLEKPIELGALELLLKRAGRHRRLAQENEELRRRLAQGGVLGNLVGQTAVMQEIFSLIRQVAPTTAAVLVTGESGTGKELVARALHESSARRDGPFCAINCAAMPDTLIESEMFGHEKGAFTGAVERRIGALEAAQGGTLFLDELSEMPLPLQAKLLRVLEDFRFRRLGGRQDLEADVRIVAATNRDPLSAIRSGHLREDLYYRLNVFQIQLPPLRERRADIPAIVEAMIAQMNQKHGTRVTEVSPAFREWLLAREWPGNVRELRNVVERATILCGTGPLETHHALAGTRSGPILSAFEPKAATPMAAAAAASHAPPLPMPEQPISPPVTLPAPPAPSPSSGINLAVGMTIDEAERLLIEATLDHAGNNKTKAASILGISTKTLHVKLRQYRLGDSEPEVEAHAE